MTFKPALFPIFIAIGIVFVWMAVRAAGRGTTKPAWMLRQERQDQLNAWRKLPRAFRLIVVGSWGVSMASILRLGALYNTYMLYSPRAADPQSGRIYPYEFKGVTAFLSAEEMTNYKRSEYSFIAAFVLTASLMAAAHVWASRKAVGRSSNAQD